LKKISSTTLKRNQSIVFWSSVGLLCAYSLLILSRFVFFEPGIEFRTFLTFLIFSLPLVFHYFKLYTFSRIALCWVPVFGVYYNFIARLQAMEIITSDHYQAMKIFLLAFSAIPFLVLDTREKWILVIGILPAVVGIILVDPIMDGFGVGPLRLGEYETSVRFNSLRTSCAFLALGTTCFSLRFLVDRTDQLNQKLIAELEEKNALIKKNAESEVTQLNQQLLANLDELTISANKSIRALSERDDAKRELENAYERLSYHINHTPLAVIERDKDLNITFWNKRAEELFGWSSEEVMGKKTYDFLIAQRDRDQVKKFLEEMAGQKLKSSFLEVHNITKGGKKLDCQWYYSMVHDAEENLETVLSFVSDVTEQRTSNYLLKERIKELTTLYQVSQLLSVDNNSLQELLMKIAAALPPGWQYPEICAAEIQVNNTHASTGNFENTPYQLIAPLSVDHEKVGFIKVVYLTETPAEVEGPFFVEERNLLNAIADMLCIYLERRQEQNELDKAKANLEATMNNTEIMIWSVDREFNLLTFNEPFRSYNERFLNIELKAGFNHRSVMDGERSKKWDERYLRALSGEQVIEEFASNGIDFRFSLSPIIEKGNVIGVSAFAENVTERNIQNKALVEANKKIGEFRVMALRSVMNPHFIFNVLNSIQFFIANNERMNAINYLSTFSKLIRMVLTHSVSDRITLAEEIEMLENYIQLEKVRFEDKFDYFFEIEETLCPDDLRIPSLLIQPYVENAILHGLYNKKDHGKLIIRVKGTDDHIAVEIEDDGVGREGSAKLKSPNQPSHKSMGTKLTEERLKLINEQSGVAVSFTDLMKNGAAAGTRVTLNIDPK
jgi:PAS domain S-box-containing protein